MRHGGCSADEEINRTTERLMTANRIRELKNMYDVAFTEEVKNNSNLCPVRGQRSGGGGESTFIGSLSINTLTRITVLVTRGQWP